MEQFRELIHGGDVAAFAHQFPGRDCIDFSASINPLGLPDGVSRALQASASDCVRYPDALCRALRAALSRYEVLPPGWILCGNGAADLIYRLSWALRPKRALLLAPTFSEYEQALIQTGCQVQFHQLSPDNDFDVGEDLLSKIPGMGLVFLCNPNNPTGRQMEPRQMLRIAQSCAEQGTWLVVDECFMDFVEECKEHTLTHWLKEFCNLLVLKAFTKMYAMPGLRLGYLMSSNECLLASIEQAGPPWSVSVPAQLCGIAAVEETDYVEQSRALIARERVYLQQELCAMGLKVWNGVANFLLFRSSDLLLAEKLMKKGILLRDCKNFHGLSPGYFRCAVRLRNENDALLRAISEINHHQA